MPKSEKEKGPRPAEIVIAAFLSLLLGAVGSAVFLAFQDPEEVTSLPGAEERGFAVVYHVPGKPGNQTHATWQIKREVVQRQRTGTVPLIEEELNQWAAQEFREGAGDSGDEPILHIRPGTPRFRMADGVLFVAMPMEWRVFGTGRKFLSQAHGSFVPRGGQYVFEHERLYIGSLPVPKVFGLSDLLVRRVVNSFDVPNELREGWANLESVSVEDETLRLVIP
jgi:hypothetical protein